MIPTASLDHAMRVLAAQFGPANEPPGMVLASLSPNPSAIDTPPEGAPISVLTPARAESMHAALVPPGPADALSAIASLGKSGEESESAAAPIAYAPQPELLAPSNDLPDPATQLGINMTGLREAIAFYKNSELAAGDRVAANAPDPLVRTTLEWVALRTNQRETGFKRVTTFLEAHPGWPSGPWLRKRAEESLYTDNPSPARVKQYFASGKPQTVHGKLALARALLAEGQKAQAAELVRSAWREGDLNPWLEGSIKKNFGDLLEKADYKYRADRLLYKEDTAGAMRSAQSAGPDVVLLTKARIAVINEGASDKEMAAVPAALQSDPGYLFSKIQKLRRAKKFDEAVQVLLSAPRDPALIINGDEWWTERRMLSRKMLDKGDVQSAYRICDEHSAQRGDLRVEAEFHAGWIALRFLNDPVAAARHFAIASLSAETPISLARVAYWQGRAAEANGAEKAAEAKEFYRKAATHSATFYGQLARTKLGLVAGQVRSLPPAAEGNQRHEVVRTIELLYAIGEKDLALPLVTESAQRLEGADQVAALARVLANDRDAKVSLAFGKLAGQRGVQLD
ncbi:MAG: lytic transglycosylase domain-containing protein, partial [Methylobacteriaceae bacterium]|nr:lytic transglycosylase domain-containing protein [Methylobacteriaceae bacterium]